MVYLHLAIWCIYNIKPVSLLFSPITIALGYMEYERIHETLVNFAMIRDSFFKIQLEMNINELEGLRHFCEISDNVDCDRFYKFTKIVLSQHKDIRTFEWIPCIRNADRNRFVNNAREHGMEKFDIWEYADNGVPCACSRTRDLLSCILYEIQGKHRAFSGL